VAGSQLHEKGASSGLSNPGNTTRKRWLHTTEEEREPKKHGAKNKILARKKI
jgi:hypothetical protein